MMVCAPILVECFIAAGTAWGREGIRKTAKRGHFFLRKQDTEESGTHRDKKIAIEDIRVNIFAFFLTHLFMVD